MYISLCLKEVITIDLPVNNVACTHLKKSDNFLSKLCRYNSGECLRYIDKRWRRGVMLSASDTHSMAYDMPHALTGTYRDPVYYPPYTK